MDCIHPFNRFITKQIFGNPPKIVLLHSEFFYLCSTFDYFFGSQMDSLRNTVQIYLDMNCPENFLDSVSRYIRTSCQETNRCIIDLCIQTRNPRFFLRLSSDLPHSLSIDRRIHTFQLKVDERGVESWKRVGTDSKGIRKRFFWWVGGSVEKNLGKKGESGLHVG